MAVSDLTFVHLASKGVTTKDVLSFVLANENNPGVIFKAALENGVSAQMLAEVVGEAIPTIDLNAVRQFFSRQGFDSLQLDNSYLQQLGKTDFKSLFDKTNLKSGGSINDTITLGAGENYADGGLGDDTITGSIGNDLLLGGSGNDEIDGGRGSDYIEGGFGKDKLYGGKFADSKYVSGYWLGNQYIYGYYEYTVDHSTNLIYGEGGDDYIEGGYGADMLDGGDGADRINGGDYSYYDDVIYDHDVIYGRGGDDDLSGKAGNDVIYGGLGDDEIYGGSGADTLYGEEGNDSIYSYGYYSSDDDNTVDYLFGGTGDDYLVIGTGDKADGGVGNDKIIFNAPNTAVAVTTAEIIAGEGADQIKIDDLSESSHVIVDLSETTQAKDDIYNVSFQGTLSEVALEVRGFNIKYDTFNLGWFDHYGSDYGNDQAGYVNKYSNYNYSQIVKSASENYLIRQTSGETTPDSYGKGFFVIQGAQAAASDIVSAATLIDSYGNDAKYEKGAVHYFLINVGAENSALYRFKDDSGADSNVVPDELTPVALFVGVRTEDFSTQDLINVFV